MNRLAQKSARASRRTHRVRTIVRGTTERPRLTVKVSNLHITAQVVDDSLGKTLAYVTTAGQKVPGTMTEKAVWAGAQIAAKAKKAKVTKVAFDRNSRQYHGRIKALADEARKNGLEF